MLNMLCDDFERDDILAEALLGTYLGKGIHSVAMEHEIFNTERLVEINITEHLAYPLSLYDDFEAER